MARDYPKFLFQHVTEAKSPGKYIVHLMEPYVLFKVAEQGREVSLKVVTHSDQAEREALIKIMNRAMAWYLATYRKITNTHEVDLIPSGKSLNDAYDEMIHVRGIHNVLDLSRQTVNNLRAYFKNNEKLTNDKKREQLLKAGWVVVQTERWAKVDTTLQG